MGNHQACRVHGDHIVVEHPLVDDGRILLHKNNALRVELVQAGHRHISGTVLPRRELFRFCPTPAPCVP